MLMVSFVNFYLGSISSIWFTNRGKDCKGWRSQFRSVAKEWSDSATLKSLIFAKQKATLKIKIQNLTFVHLYNRPQNSIAKRTFAFPYRCTSLSCHLWPRSLLRRKRTAPSENAHFRCTFPILLWPPFSFLPADSWEHFTRRQ